MLAVTYFRKISMVKDLLLLQAQEPSFPNHPGSPKRRFKFQITSSNLKKKKKSYHTVLPVLSPKKTTDYLYLKDGENAGSRVRYLKGKFH